MPVDPQRLLARPFAPFTHRYTVRDTILYALGIGLGSDPTDARELRFVYEQGIEAFPTLVNVIGYPGFWAREPDTGIDWRRIVHAEQSVALHARIPAAGTVTSRTRVSALWDKGPEKGVLMEQVRELRFAGSAPVATLTQVSMLRGDGGCGSAGNRAPAPAHELPTRAPDAICDLATLPQAALIYRLSGDDNPLHADPSVAAAAGYPRPILHGLCTMGVAARAVVRSLPEGGASRLGAMRVRFTAPVFPGETLRTEIWVDGSVVSLRTRAIDRDVVVLDRGRVDLVADPLPPAVVA